VFVTLSDARAKRYAVTLPVRYRLAGSELCETGWTENMSVSGLLFSTAVMLDVGSKLEVWIQMSSGPNGNSRSMLYCEGSVVRQVVVKHSRSAAAVRIARVRVLSSIPDFTTMLPEGAREGHS
jgi:hypothetical protein